jgi:hypothetical protein
VLFAVASAALDLVVVRLMVASHRAAEVANPLSTAPESMK